MGLSGGVEAGRKGSRVLLGAEGQWGSLPGHWGEARGHATRGEAWRPWEQSRRPPDLAQTTEPTPPARHSVSLDRSPDFSQPISCFLWDSVSLTVHGVAKMMDVKPMADGPEGSTLLTGTHSPSDVILMSLRGPALGSLTRRNQGLEDQRP